MHAYARAMRTNRPARPARPAHLTYRPRHLGRPGLAPVLAGAAAVAVALTALVTAVVVALACYLAGAPSRDGGPGSDHRARTVSTSPLLGPTVGRGAGSATCRHAPRSPRCLREGGTAAVVRDPGAARPVGGGDDQTVLIGGEGARPAEVPGRAPSWVGEEGPSRA